jgi:fibro-slime domain-containing protein
MRGMMFLPVAGSFSVHPAHCARVARQRGASLVGVVALALLAACGAGGESTPGIVVPPEGLGPMLGGNGGASSDPSNPFLNGGDCSGPSCELAGDGPLMTPPGCGDGTLTDDEACDDGNLTSGDGCEEHCLATEAGYSCASPGLPCRLIARCGDGVVAPTERCDDGNITAGDGCSDRCRVELGKKCDGAPSVCTDAICGNGLKEGAEACDDGNTTPFDGCSSLCLTEPNCSGPSCVSECGDGLIINEDCDDGNVIDGDGCSSSCTRETGFECQANAVCETLNGQCVLRVPAIFRDFGDAHQDFGEDKACTALAIGAVEEALDQNRRPALVAANAANACLSTPANFTQWYTSQDGVNQTLVGDIVLFENGEGGYVNRYGANGEQFLGIQAPPVNGPNPERGFDASLAACATRCEAETANQLQCQNRCNPINNDNQQLLNQINQATNQLNQAEAQNPPNPVTIADLEEQIADLQDQLAAGQDEFVACQTDCAAELETGSAACAETCKPCRTAPQMFCSGGVAEFFDGSPLFFPVDSISTGPTSNPFEARVPDQYGWNGFPFERQLFPGLPNASYLHNFYFTSEVQYWFKYDETTEATLTFLGDDDVWVFLNGRLAVDLGGIHVPALGSIEINGAAGTTVARMQDQRPGANGALPAPIVRNGTTAAFGLVPGNVYTISVFQAERKRDGSSFQLTLAGFEATPSDCTAICDDGVLSFGEECDDGINDGGYGECNPGCVLGPFCGDGIQQPEFGEDCDVGPLGSGTCRGCRQLTVR